MSWKLNTKHMKFQGTVIRGGQVGARFGIATANLSSQNTPPDLEEGVYFVQAEIDGNQYNGLLHYGPRKTFGASATLELHLLDVDDDLYEKTITVEVLKRIRDVEQFQNADALFTQVEKDIVQARKFFLRREILDQWQSLEDTEKKKLATEALKKIAAHPAFQNAKTISIYAPMEGEIEFVQSLCTKEKEKTFCFPRVEGGQMRFYSSSWTDLKPGKFGILEPEKNLDLAPDPDLVFVPAVAVDSNNYRLGRGGGFYDRFLEDFKGLTITVVPKFAVVEKLPTAEHDVKVKEIIVV